MLVGLCPQDYLKIVKMPMDLSTVGANLALGQYSSLQEFLDDMKLIFQNAFRYNPKGSKVDMESSTKYICFMSSLSDHR